MANALRRQFENEKAVVLLSSDAHDLYYLMDLDGLRQKYWSSSETRPLLGVCHYDDETEEFVNVQSANEIIDLLTTEGGSRIERLLNSYRQTIDRRSLTAASDSDDPAVDAVYDLPSGVNLLYNLAHGVYTIPDFMGASGLSGISATRTLSTSGPQYQQHNPYELFARLSNFYDFILDQQPLSGAHHMKRERLGAFFDATTFSDVDAIATGDRLGYWSDLRECLTTAGITSLDDIKNRVREFEEDFYPGEFQKALVGIRHTRDWLRQLKS